MDNLDSEARTQVISYKTVSLQSKLTEQRTIVIPTLPINLNEERLEKHFKQWGIIEHVMCDRETQDIAVVVFKHDTSVKKVLTTDHILHENTLTVEQVDYDSQTNKENYFRAQTLLKQVKHSQLLKILKDCITIEDQLEILQQELCLSQESIDYRQSLRDHFHQLFVKYFPESDLQLFGSSVGGYGFEGADIDIFLKLPEYYFTQGSRVFNFTPDPNDVEMENAIMKLFTTEARLKLLMKVLKENMPDCRDFQFYPSKICPLVKFQYIDDKYSLPCDLSAFIQTAVVCSKLMRLYHDLDPRVTPLMVSLRYWSECQNLIVPRKKLKTFTFTLLVVYFLQTRNPPILPAVGHLRRLTDSQYSIGKWDCSFCDDINKIPKSTNSQTPEELLKEFFAFYANFDFREQIICVRWGKSFSRKDFLSDPANKGFHPRDISIQHFFELNRNTTFKCVRSFRNELSMKFIRAAQICNNFSPMNCRVDSNWGLGKLLEEMVFFNERDKMLVSCLINCNCDTERLLREYEQLEEIWLAKVCLAVEKVLSVGLYSECEVVDNIFYTTTSNTMCKHCAFQQHQLRVSRGTEKDKVEAVLDSRRECDRETGISKQNLNSERDSKGMSYDENMLLVLKCKVWDDVWVKRSYYKSQFSSEFSLGLEREVSQCVIREHRSNTFIKFECIVKRIRNKNLSIMIEMIPHTRTTFHKTKSILALVYRLVHACMRDFPHYECLNCL